MKKALILLAFLPGIVSAQNMDIFKSKAQKMEFNSRTNAPSFMELKPGENLRITNPQSDAWARELFGLRADDRLNFIRQYEDKFVPGLRHYKYSQSYKGIPVEFSMIRVQEQNGIVRSVAGDLQLNLLPENEVTIDFHAALSEAVEAVPANKYKWNMKEEEAMLKIALNQPDFTYDPVIKKVLLPIGEGADRKYYYAYKIDVYAHEPEARFDVYIDAETGQLLMKIPTICSIDVPATAHTKYHGIQTITTDSIAPNQYELKEVNRKGIGQQIETRDCNTGNENQSIPFVDNNNVWDTTNAEVDEAALDCHFAAEMTFDYYYDSLQRNSWDDNGAKLLQFVHFDNAWFNAQWTGSYSRYGDGTGNPLTSIDVVSHEITHGVTQETAGLIYRSESGALNESFSDIFGTTVEFAKLNAGASWIIGVSSFALRSMANPNQFGNPDTYDGQLWTSTRNCIPDDNNDYCGVHNNSGVQNFWYYLLVNGGTGTNDKGNAYNVTGLGFSKAAKIAYKNLRDYLTPQSNYDDARKGAIQAAVDLFGFDSQEYQSVINAWYAVGVGKPYSFLPDADFTITELVCKPNQVVAFKNLSGSALTYFWDFGDGNTSLLENPTHAYANEGNYNVRLIAQNPNGADTITKNNFIFISTQDVAPTTCTADVTSPVGTTGIYRVELANLDKESVGPLYEDLYMDFTCYRALIEAGQSYPMKVTTYKTAPVFTRVYIDWNNDGAFDPPTELVMATDNTVQNHYDTISVPLNAVKNIPLRMRVVSARAVTNKPDEVCSKLRNGQIEDYGVVVSPASGIETNNFNRHYKVYPNPSQGLFYIFSPLKRDAATDIAVWSILGVKKYESTLPNDGLLDLSHLESGVYLLEFKSGNQRIEMLKIVVY